MTNNPEEEGLFSRWSRRKLATKEIIADVEDAQPELTKPELTKEETEAELVSKKFDPSELPDIDTLGPGSDFKPFMQQGVPSALKRAALRKLWRSNPVLANVDGLVDYGEDFTNNATVIEGLKTAYQVGKGMVKKLDEIAEREQSSKDDHAALQEQLNVTAGTDGEDRNPVEVKRNCT